MYDLREATDDDYGFLYGLLVATMKEYVERTWGWDEADQRERFRNKFRPEDYQVIVVDGRDVGVTSVVERGDGLFLAEIQITPESQNRGLGTAVVQDVMRDAERRGLPVALQVLKTNPARRLDERLGFRVTGETDTHFQMRWSR